MRSISIATILCAAVASACSTSQPPAPVPADEVPPPGSVDIPAPVADDCIVTPAPGLLEASCDGLDFRLNVPELCMTKACGLIVDVHGFSMTAAIQDTHTELAARGAASGFIVLQPSANGSPPSWTSADDDKVLALIERALAVFHVQRERVHFGGFSQGGYMTWRFLCAHGELFGSMAPLAAGVDGSTEDCVGAAQGPSVLLTHGTTDGLVPFEGSAVARDIIVAEWGMGEPTTLSADETHTWSGYGNEAGTRFEFLEHDWETSFMLGSNALAGHCVPGSDAFLGCGADNPVVWGDALIAFYLAHPR